MPETLVTSVTSFSITRVLNADREKVFDAWTKPAQMKQWFCPPGFSVASAEADAHPGGAYRIGMKPSEGDVLYVSGKFVEVRRPEKIVFTWAWDEDDGPGHESLVTIELTARGMKTELVLTHERLAGAESRDKHVHGWVGCLDNLATLLEA